MKLLEKSTGLNDKLNSLKYRIRCNVDSEIHATWIISCEPEGPGGRLYQLVVRNDGCGRPEFVRRVYDEGDCMEVLTDEEYTAGIKEHGAYDSTPEILDKYEREHVMENLISYPSAFEAMRLRWEALNMVASFSLT